MFSQGFRMFASWLCLTVWALSFFFPPALIEIGLLALIACVALRSTLRDFTWHNFSKPTQCVVVAYLAGMIAFTLARALHLFPSQVEEVATLLVRVSLIPFAAFVFNSDWRSLQKSAITVDTHPTLPHPRRGDSQ